MSASPTPPSESSPRAPRWERRKESRPAELLAAALDIFVEKGFAATRLDDVAQRAGVSKGTVYLYYTGKDELFKAVVRETIVPMIIEHQRDVEQSDAPCAELLGRFFEAWWARFGATKLSGIAKLIVSEASNFPEVARFFQQEVVLPNIAVLSLIVRRGIERGEFRPIDVDSAVYLWMAPLVLKAIWMHSVDTVCPVQLDLSPQRMIAAHADMILNAIRMSPVTGPEAA
jgi:AcrR family transcriptional regulator